MQEFWLVKAWQMPFLAGVVLSRPRVCTTDTQLPMALSALSSLSGIEDTEIMEVSGH